MLKVTSSPRYSLHSFVQEGRSPSAKFSFTSLQSLIAISRPMWTRVWEECHWTNTVFLKTRASNFTGLVLSSTPLNLLTTKQSFFWLTWNVTLRVLLFVWFVVWKWAETFYVFYSLSWKLLHIYKPCCEVHPYLLLCASIRFYRSVYLHITCVVHIPLYGLYIQWPGFIEHKNI